MDFEKIRLTNIRAMEDQLPLKRGSYFIADMILDGKVLGLVYRDGPQFSGGPFGTWFRWAWYLISNRVNSIDFFWSRLQETLKTEDLNLVKADPEVEKVRQAFKALFSPEIKENVQVTATLSGPEPREEETEPPRPAAPPVKKKLKLTKIHSTGAYQVLIEGKPFEVREAANGEWIVSDETGKDVASRKSLDECRDFLDSISGPKLDRDGGGFYTSVVNGKKYYIQNLGTNYWSVQTNHREIFQGDTLTQCREFLKKIAAGEVTIPEESDKRAS